MTQIILILLLITLSGVRVQNPNHLTERIGNFSMELLYHTSEVLDGKNFIMSPFTVWNVLAILAEGGIGVTRREINYAIRINSGDLKNDTVKTLSQFLKIDTESVQLAKINSMFVNKNRLLQKDFQTKAKQIYEVDVLSLDFAEGVRIANVVNSVIANVTHGQIKKIVDSDYFQNTQMILSSALYFKGQWSVPFNASLTARHPFYDSKGQKIGYVNMMHIRYTYPFTNFRELRSRVIELPYGDGNKISMYVILPNPGVNLGQVFRSFQLIDLKSFFEEMRLSNEQYPDDEVDCYIPRFNIETDQDLTELLQKRFGINQVFDSNKANLPLMARFPLHVSSIFHKAHIEVTEEGTKAAGVTLAELKNRSGAVPFIANRPFAYFIVEKVTNIILLGGVYMQPALY